jgi:hypothetical protein
MSDDGFKNSPEYDDWIESGGRDEDYNFYYEKWHGERIHVAIALETPPAGVDTPEDLARVQAFLAR